MRILIAGATGFIGRHLTTVLQKDHEIVVLGRDKNKLKKEFPKFESVVWSDLVPGNPVMDAIDLVINLSGEPIADSRWTIDKKRKILHSRVNATEALVEACIHSKNKNIRLFNASGIGIYGLARKTLGELNSQRFYDESFIPESVKNGSSFIEEIDFLSEVALSWEQSLAKAESHGLNVVKMRFGVVLDPSGGVLQKLLPIFKWGLGGPMGSGKQLFSWVALTDLIDAINFLIHHPNIHGPVNIVAPDVLTQRDFSKTLAKILNRPAFFALPAWFLKLQLGQMGEELLLKGLGVRSKVLIDNGFQFSFPSLKSALKALLKREKTSW